jgi:hypothetical protein
MHVRLLHQLTFERSRAGSHLVQQILCDEQDLPRAAYKLGQLLIFGVKFCDMLICPRSLPRKRATLSPIVINKFPIRCSKEPDTKTSINSAKRQAPATAFDTLIHHKAHAPYQGRPTLRAFERKIFVHALG